MAVKLCELYKKVNDALGNALTLEAGEGGMSNLVSWFHMVEGSEIASFLEGREIVVTTGIALKESNDTLLSILQQCIEMGASAMIVNLGPYIDHIDEEVLSFCNENSFPVFSSPWKVNMSNVVRIIAMEVTHHMEKRRELVSAFRNAIFFSSQKELYIPVLERYDYEIEWHYCIATILIVRHDAQELSKEEVHKLRIKAENMLAFLAPNAILFRSHSDLLICFANRSEESIEAVMTQLNDALLMHQKPYQMYIGIGRNTQSVRCIHKTYRIALQAARLQQRLWKPYQVISYRSMGVSRLFLSMEDKDIMQEYYESVIKGLIEYDRLNDTDYVQFLQVYFDEGCHVAQTAQRLFLHRNSITYKLHKIEEILSVDLNDFQTRVELMMALKLRLLI